MQPDLSKGFRFFDSVQEFQTHFYSLVFVCLEIEKGPICIDKIAFHLRDKVAPFITFFILSYTAAEFNANGILWSRKE